MASPDFRARRLYVAPDLAAGTELALDSKQSNYLLNVIRLEPGAGLLIFNGRDGEWRARLLPAARRQARLKIEARERPQSVVGDLTYAFAPLKHARLDYLVQKAVEMGVATLSPVLTRHTQVTRVNVGRMRANVIEAAEQCGILSPPSVEEPVSFSRWLAALAPDRVVVFCDEETGPENPITALAKAPEGAITLLIGPEGGFDEDERRALLARGRVVRLSLGPRILRADTAAVAALALVQAARGDWR